MVRMKINVLCLSEIRGQYNERIILVKMETKPKDTVVVHVYMPNSNSCNTEIEEVYDDIEKVNKKVKN